MSQLRASDRVRLRPLGEIVTFLDHQRRPVRSDDRKAGPYPYYGANGLQGTIDGYLFDEQLVLLAEDGGHFEEPERGIAYRVSGKTWVNNHAHVLRPGPDVEWAYLARVLENVDVRQYISGTTRAKLTKGQAENILLPIPPLSEQRRIAAILDQADALRAKRRAAIAQLDMLTQAIFWRTFGDGGGIRTKLADVCSRVTDGTHLSPSWANTGVPFLFVSNVTSGEIDFKTKKFISEATHTELTRQCSIEMGDILYSTVGSYGHCAIIRTERKFAFQRHLAHVKPNRAVIEPEFLNAVMASPMFRS